MNFKQSRESALAVLGKPQLESGDQEVDEGPFAELDENSDAMRNAIAQRTTVNLRAALMRPWYANGLNFQVRRGRAHYGITVRTLIYEREIRRNVRISFG